MAPPSLLPATASRRGSSVQAAPGGLATLVALAGLRSSAWVEADGCFPGLKRAIRFQSRGGPPAAGRERSGRTHRWFVEVDADRQRGGGHDAAEGGVPPVRQGARPGVDVVVG